MVTTERQGLTTGIIIAISAAIAFAASGPFGKLLLEAGWSPGGLVLARVLCAAILLLPPVLWSIRKDPGVVLRRGVWIVAYGAVAVAFTQLFYYLAVARLHVGTALLIEFLAPVLLLFIVWARTRVRPAVLSLVGAALAIGGLFFVLSPSNDGPLDPIGVLWGSLAAVSLAGYFLLSANAPHDLPPIALIGGGLWVASGALAIAGAVGALPIVVEFVEAVPFFGASVPWWVPLGLVVVVGTSIAYLLGLIAAIKLGSRLASFLGLIEVVAVMVVAALLLGEIPTYLQVFGAVLIVAGVIAVRLAPERTPLAEQLAEETGTLTGPIVLPSTLGATSLTDAAEDETAPSSEGSARPQSDEPHGRYTS